MMKRLQLNAFFFVALFLFTNSGIAQFAAQKPNHPAGISPEKENNGLWIHYDSGENDNGIGLNAGGEFQSAIRWEPSDLSYLNGMQITSVRVYINDMPNSAAIIIYQGADEASLQPMNFHVYEPVADSWNEIIIDSPVVIDTSLELWISSQVDDPGQNYYPVGMDSTIEDAVGFGNMVNLGDGWEILTDLANIPGVFSLQAFVEPAPAGDYMVTFRVNMANVPEFNPEQHNVYLTGSFTGWSEPGHEGSIQMTPVRENGQLIFTATVELEPGEYIYKYFSDAYGEGWEGGEWPGPPERAIEVSQSMTINDTWGLYSEFPFELSLVANPEGSGTLTGGGQYQAGEIVNLQALASDGFIFLNWTDEYDNIINENSDFQYIMQASHHTLTANFTDGEPGQYLLTLQVVPHEGGQVSGDGVYNQGDQVIVSATPNQGYVFHNWRKSGTVIGNQAQMVYTMPAEHVTLTAHFYSEDNPLYTLTLQRQPQVGGTVTGAGDYLEGEEVVLSANPSEGYGFIRWLEMGSGNADTEPVFIYTMPARDATLIAYFDLIDYVYHYENPDLKLFPNPAQSTVTISSGETINKIEITDITGKLVYHSIPKDTKILVSLAGWENGIYIVRTFTSNQVFLKKLHVQK